MIILTIILLIIATTCLAGAHLWMSQVKKASERDSGLWYRCQPRFHTIRAVGFGFLLACIATLPVAFVV